MQLNAKLELSENDKKLAQECSQRLRELLPAKPKKPFRIHIDTESGMEQFVIPAAAFRLLNGILAEMAKGNAVALLPVDSELTTRQAAELLKVSRPFLIEQLEKGCIPFRKVGTHRRVLFKDLMTYKQSMVQKRLAALEELSALDQKLDFGY